MLVACIVIAGCSSTSTDPGFSGKSYSGTLSGGKSGSFTLNVNDANGNSTGTAVIDSRSYPLVAGISKSGQVVGSGELLGAGNFVVGSISFTGNATSTSMQANWNGTLPVSSTSATTSNYTGTMSGSASSTSGTSGNTATGLTGTWDLIQGSLLVARQTYSGGTLAVRSWSTTLPQLDGAYAEYTYTSTSTTYTTTATLVLLCDFVRGVWVADSSRPVGTIAYSITNNGNSLTVNGGTYVRSTGTITKPSVGGACTKQ
jgi:hypothetical protein